MKHDIIKTDNYLLVVDESEIKEGEYTYYPPPVGNEGIGKAIITQQGWNKKIIAHLPLNGSPILKGVDLLPPLEVDNSLGTPLVQYIFEKHNQDRVMGFCDGYNKAKEKYKYTEEDMRKAFLKGVSITREGYNAEYAQGNEPDIECVFGEKADKFIQSLSQPKMPIGFECAMKSIPCPDNKPDCIVCHMGIMTTTTPEGHTQWVGTYIY